MRQFRTVVLLSLVLVALSLAHAKSKKQEVSSIFSNAHYVYVQAIDGDIMRPGLYPEDRDAISTVQQAVRDWNRYVITTDRNHADLVFIVRKGRLAAAQLHGGVATAAGPVSTPPGPQVGPPPNTRGQMPGDQQADQFGVQTEVGPSDDLFRVFSRTPSGKLSGPIWSREMKDGLDPPSVLLLRQLKDAVEAAYPAQPPAKHPTP